MSVGRVAKKRTTQDKYYPWPHLTLNLLENSVPSLSRLADFHASLAEDGDVILIHPPPLTLFFRQSIQINGNRIGVRKSLRQSRAVTRRANCPDEAPVHNRAQVLKLASKQNKPRAACTAPVTVVIVTGAVSSCCFSCGATQPDTR